MRNHRKMKHKNQIVSSRKTKGVANGPSKTPGLANFFSNLTGLAVSFFYTKVSRSLDFLQG